MLDLLKNHSLYLNKYRTHAEAVVIACYFNPQNSPYRRKAFKIFYDSIRHLNHRIVECVIGDAQPELPQSPYIERVHTQSLLWHKESLLNRLVARLPAKYRYVFWLDADVIFENKHWLTEGVRQLRTYSLIQPFEYCVHLEKDQVKYPPRISLAESHQQLIRCLERGIHPGPIRIWRSFCANHAAGLSGHPHYDIHGHVGFAWGARREVLEAVPLYDRALIGGADHIIAHAGAGHLHHACIAKSFTDNIAEVNEWSQRFHEAVQGRLGFVPGNLLHLWHGDVEKREYLKRIQDFTPQTRQIKEKDENGLYVTQDDTYVRNYFSNREVRADDPTNYSQLSDSSSSFGSTPPGWDDTRTDVAEAVVFGGGSFGGGGAGGSWDSDDAIPVHHESNPADSTVPLADNQNPSTENTLLENNPTENNLVESYSAESNCIESSHFS